jgi:transposase
MNGTKYVGMDVHTATIFVAVQDADGKLIMESVIEAKRNTIVQFIQGLRGEVLLTFEEGTWSAWLYDMLTPYVTRIVVYDPRRNALLKQGSTNDRIDARKLAELLRLNSLRSVYHGENGLRALKELARAYLTISKDLVRVSSCVT